MNDDELKNDVDDKDVFDGADLNADSETASGVDTETAAQADADAATKVNPAKKMIDDSETEPETNSKAERKRGFRKGFVSGAIAAAVVCLCVSVAVNGLPVSGGNLLSRSTQRKIKGLAQFISANYYEDVDEEDLVEGLYKGLFENLDVYSTYYTAEEAEQILNSTVSGTYSGIGASLQQDTNTGSVKILHVYADSPAEKAGLKEGDYIVSADSYDASSMELSEFVNHVRGEEGTSVHLTIARTGEDAYLEFDIVRENLVYPTVSSQMLSSVKIKVFFDADTTQEQIDAIGEKIKQRSEVSSFTYVSADEVWEKFKEEYFDGDETTTASFGSENPIADKAYYEICVEDASQKEELIDYLQSLDCVSTLEASENALSSQTGYIQVTEFTDHTAEQFAEAVKTLQEENMTSLIIDVRSNPGGMLTAVCDMLDQILPEGLMVYTEDRNGNREEYRSTDDEVLDLPIAVLVNGSSASASEIFAGAIQDRGAGTLIGTTTYGKGVVQSIMQLKDGSAFKITTMKYFTPNGVCIQGIGIDPDVEIEYEFTGPEDAEYSVEYDNQIQKALEVLQQQ